MKILILSTFDIQGGAAIAAKRLLDALCEFGHEAKMLVAVKSSSDNNIIEAPSLLGAKRQKINLAAEKVHFLLYEKDCSVRFQFSTAMTGYGICSLPEVLQVDVVHIHWTLQGFLSLSEIDKLQSLSKKIVWTLHDMWAFTGGCHYPGSCTNYLRECGECPFLKNSGKDDLSHRIFLKKQKIYRNIEFVTCSNWLREVAEKSALIKDFSIHTIANPIDTEVYKPAEDREALRAELDMNNRKKYVLFGAANLADPRKGLKYFYEALELYKSTNSELPEIVFYGSDKQDFNIKEYPYRHIGFINQNQLLKYYQACDIYAISSLEDNLPNTVMEAIACGLPVLAFNTGGITDMVIHMKNGYVASHKSSSDLAKGLITMLHETDLQQWGKNSRQHCIEHFTPQIIAEQYFQLYTS